jgi:dynein heavy chain
LHPLLTQDEVAYIVDKASKEQGMEKMLVELEATWGIMNFEYDAHKRTQTPMLRPSEVKIEN